jgi:hypothetical protein
MQSLWLHIGMKNIEQSRVLLLLLWNILQEDVIPQLRIEMSEHVQT